MVKKYRALETFSGAICGYKGKIVTIEDSEAAEKLIKAGFVEEIVIGTDVNNVTDKNVGGEPEGLPDGGEPDNNNTPEGDNTEKKVKPKKDK